MDNFGKGVKVRRNTFVESFEPYKPGNCEYSRKKPHET